MQDKEKVKKITPYHIAQTHEDRLIRKTWPRLVEMFENIGISDEVINNIQVLVTLKTVKKLDDIQYGFDLKDYIDVNNLPNNPKRVASIICNKVIPDVVFYRENVIEAYPEFKKGEIWIHFKHPQHDFMIKYYT